MKVYVTYGYTNYGGRQLLKVFKNESAAKKFVDKCTAHETKRPMKIKKEKACDFRKRLGKWAKRSPLEWFVE